MIRVLSEEDCLAAARELGMGRLAVVDGEEAYAVPMLFAVAGRSLLFYLRPGREWSALRAHPRGVTMEVDDVDRAASWRSVLLVGHFEEADGEDAGRLALELAERTGPYAQIARGELRQPDARTGRLVVEQISGRAMDPAASEPGARPRFDWKLARLALASRGPRSGSAS